MPGPPPPPPMAPAAPPPPAFSMPKGSDDRGALLNSIRKGTKLKKTVTVDKSAPMISGKVNSVSNSNSNNFGTNNSTSNTASSNQSTPNGLPLAGLFAGGMPKLKPTGRLGSSTLNSSSTTNINMNNNVESPSPKVQQPARNFISVQDQLKKQLTSPSDTRTRGPPPPAPTRNMSVDETKNIKSLGLTNHPSANGLHLSHTSLQPNTSTLHLQSGRKSKSNVNLVSLDSTDSSGGNGVNISAFHATIKPVISHGKPNLAPKPPTHVNGKQGTPLKLSIIPNKPISRAQSMRSPRTPSPQTPNLADTSIKFGTVRNISTLLGPTINAQGGQVTNRQRPGLATRPSVPPPSVPAPAAPSKVSVVKPPNHAPPPPPSIPQPPSTAPPPPPNKTQQTVMAQPVRPPPAIPNSNHNSANNPPPPPPRGSSMRDTNQTRRSFTDFDVKFQDKFATPDDFPRPPHYRNVIKLYSNSQESSC
ncbi:WAS/WASL-interacting protein family member 2-like isoform X2 [Sitophilus oryzae]|uniref:WAS/WASL-interacting protein family member 2-like isoform X2 n=1 Tax=Sitophilus oryzae TaxID=7048 RepID=A0A6J2X6T0_SITOR|nr:WAS/WASL-interacting protein family member 2-like isoform X2 [Sitophilus oryzae]